MDKISVIVPVYNAQKYLVETIESIIRQTYKNIEVIFINDGSTDNSLQILEEYKKKYSNISIINQSNAGQSAARNTGINAATGDYIAFVDADDLLVNNYLEKMQIQAFKSDADFVICGYEKFNDATNDVFYCRKPSEWEEDFVGKYKHVFSYGPWGKLIKTSFINKYNIRFIEGEQLEDGPFCCILNLLAKKIVVMDFIGYRYRVYSESTMGNVRNKNHKPHPPYKGVEMVIDKFNSFNNDIENKLVMEYCVTKILTGLVTNMYKNVNSEYRKEICNHCHQIMNQKLPNIKNNPYIKITRLKHLPLSHRIAVRLFVLFNNMNLLYPFSLIVSKVL